MKSECFEKERDMLRNKWRGVRTDRLELKKNLTDNNISAGKIRKNRDYKILKKKQKHLSNMIKHIEKRICREMRNE